MWQCPLGGIARASPWLFFSPRKQPDFAFDQCDRNIILRCHLQLLTTGPDLKKLEQDGVTTSSARMALLSSPKSAPNSAGVPAGDAAACLPSMDRDSRVFTLGRLPSGLPSLPRLMCTPSVRHKTVVDTLDVHHAATK